jgi:uncharacterized protein (DUF169 family)
VLDDAERNMEYASSMPSLPENAATLARLLSLRTPPVAVLFSAEPPAGIARVAAPALAGCAYWKQAASGQAFYTTASDHLGCAIGAYTHGAELGAAGQAELEGMLGMMTEAGYLTMAEVPGIPVRPGKLEYVTYAPLASAPALPDLILVRVTPRASMLLAEAVHAAGARSATAPVMRPACAMLPAVLSSGLAATSFGCIGNRVYTELRDDEMWQALPGARLDAIVASLSVIATANQTLAAFHEGRVAAASRSV